jgi:hypothetical protein
MNSVVLVVALGILIAYASKRGAQPTAAKRKPPPPAPPAPSPLLDPDVPQTAWRLEAGPTVHFDPARRYAAVIELSFPESLASTERVNEELRKFARWQALDVWSDAADVPRNFPRPVPLSDAHGRFFALGDPATALTFARPKPIAELWSRAR